MSELMNDEQIAHALAVMNLTKLSQRTTLHYHTLRRAADGKGIRESTRKLLTDIIKSAQGEL